MGRLMVVLPVGICLALCAYLFLPPETLQQGEQRAHSVIVGNHPLQLAAATGATPSAGQQSRQSGRATARVRGRMKGVRPALLGNPPRRAARRRPRAPTLLKLPAQLPSRILDVPILM